MKIEDLKLAKLFGNQLRKNVNKSIYNKNEETIDKINQNKIHVMLMIDKSWNITNMNSENSCDISYLSQACIFLKFSQMQVPNEYKYKLKSIF